MISHDFFYIYSAILAEHGRKQYREYPEKRPENSLRRNVHIALIQVGHYQWRMAVARNALAILTASLII